MRTSMRGLLDEIRSGAFAREWIDEDATGRPLFRKARTEAGLHRIEEVGTELRKMIDFT